MINHPVKVSLKVFSDLFKALSAYCASFAEKPQ